MHKKPDFVIGLGASAGGLEALERFFDGAPSDSGGAFVVVMHLARDFKSMLDELMARHTKMKVMPVVDGAKLLANSVYVIQPGTTLEVAGDALRVGSRNGNAAAGPATTIDRLFASLAKAYGRAAGAVVLSGSGSDGARGVIAISDAGGFAAAQAPETAKFDSMPVAAIATGAVRAVEAPEALAATVLEGLTLPQWALDAGSAADQPGAMARIVNAVLGVSSLDASQYKHSTLERRVHKRMMELGCGSLAEYAERIDAHPEEARILSDSLLIGVTQFFRDPQAFEVIGEQVLPEVIHRAQLEKRPIRVWTPGCATGEEAYSLAMMFAESLRDIPQKIDVQIFATDVRKENLASAGRGEFTTDHVASIPKKYRDRCVSQKDGGNNWLIDPAIRKMIVFAAHDVLTNPPFTKLDIISCRNLLIYFSIEAQQKVLSNFAFGLVTGGFLFLGPSETVGGYRDAFEFVDARNRIFRRTQVKRSHIAALSQPWDRQRQEAVRPLGRATPRLRESALQPAYAALLRDYAPACLLMSSERELLHSFGEARSYLRPPDGPAHLDVAGLVDPALKTPIIVGAERALRDRKPISFGRITLSEAPHNGRVVNLTIRPLQNDESGQRFVMAAIEDAHIASEPAGDAATLVNIDTLADERIKELERELEHSREALQSTIEEIESTNEELQASNEELMSSNEELQSTNEELSSLNEELYSVNAEYHRQNDQLARLSEDFDILLRSTEVGVLFFDDGLSITRYTSLAGQVFNLTNADVGRSIATFRSPFPNLDPAAMLNQALNEAGVVETEVLDASGEVWLVRAIAHEGSRGVVMTLINIQRLRSAESSARRSMQMLQSIRETNRSFYLEFDTQLRRITDELGYADHVGQDHKQARGPLANIPVHADDADELKAIVKRARASGVLDGLVRLWRAADQRHEYVRLGGRRADDGVWRAAGVEVDDIVRARRQAEEQGAILEAVLRASPSMISFIDRDEIIRYANPAYAERLGRSPEDVIGQPIADVLDAKAYAAVADRLKKSLEGERQEFLFDEDQSEGDRRISVICEPVRNGAGVVKGMATDAIDVTGLYAQATKLGAADAAIAAAMRRSTQGCVLVDTATGGVVFANANALRRMGPATPPASTEGVKASRLTPDWGEKRWRAWLNDVSAQRDAVVHDVNVFDDEGQPTLADLRGTNVNVEETNYVFVQIVENPERLAALDNLKERSRELANSNRDLEQFAIAIAHDLRAPVRHVNNFADMLMRALDSGSDKVSYYAGVVRSKAILMDDMVEGLLEYARIGLAPRDFETVDLNESLAKAQALLSGDINDNSAEITADNLPLILGDDALMVRVFQNLLSNAIKYKKDQLSPKIHVEAERNGETSVIRFSDNGIGIKATHGDKIFALFQRLHTDDVYPGLGLGLATCRRICEFHGGSIVHESEYADGAQFVLTFPTIRTTNGRRANAACTASTPS